MTPEELVKQLRYPTLIGPRTSASLMRDAADMIERLNADSAEFKIELNDLYEDLALNCEDLATARHEANTTEADNERLRAELANERAVLADVDELGRGMTIGLGRAADERDAALAALAEWKNGMLGLHRDVVSALDEHPDAPGLDQDVTVRVAMLRERIEGLQAELAEARIAIEGARELDAHRCEGLMAAESRRLDECVAHDAAVRERDEARADHATAYANTETLAKECDRLRAELAREHQAWVVAGKRVIEAEAERDRMRPVVEAAVKWRHGSAYPDADLLEAAVDAYLKTADRCAPDDGHPCCGATADG